MPIKLRNLLVILFISVVVLYPADLSAQNGQMVKLSKVVIDPGHGGKHPGAVSKDNKILEKNITLSIALLLGEMIEKNYPDVEVIYTRKTDKFVSVLDRALLANSKNADLFISIHINSAKSTQASGTETFVMGTDKAQSNLEVCQIENSVIVVEEDYTTKYAGFDPKNPESYIIFSLLQNAHLEQSLHMAGLIQDKLGSQPIKNNRGVKQGPLLVLWRCKMPAVLVELGFLSNTSDLKVLSNKTNHKAMATSMYEAFCEYKAWYEKSDIVTPSETSSPYYTIQIFTSGRILKENDREFKGIKGYHYRKTGNVYKYSVGKYSTKEEAMTGLKKIRETFPEAFVTKIE